MRGSRGRLLLFGLLAALAVGWSGRAEADQHDPELPALFDALRAAPDAEAAAPIEAQVWAAWLHSEDAHVNTLMEQGVAAMNAGAFEDALAAFDAVTAGAPGFAEGWNKRATVLYLLGRIDESVADIGRALALEPRHFGALSGLGLCEQSRGHDRAALDAFERALRIDPQSVSIRTNRNALKRRLEGEPV